MSQQFDVPKDLEHQIFRLLKSMNISLEQHHKICDSILKQSDFYIKKPFSATPWHEDWAQVAQIIYYLPLNYVRFSKIIQEAVKTNFFSDLKTFIDFGSGLGAASLHLENHFDEGICVEANPIAEKLHKVIQSSRNLKWTQRMYEVYNPRKSLAVFSYSLTEEPLLPDWALGCEAIIIMEPSTHQDGRKLLELRKKLIESGFYIWAPCLHQGNCPLLSQSQKDWCHDRVIWVMPDWFKKLESHLPIKNKTLTYSYLMARKRQPEQIAGKARMVGDILEEKGKSKIMICRGEDREFLSWLHKDVKEQNLNRGDVISVPLDIVIKSSELRTKSKL